MAVRAAGQRPPQRSAPSTGQPCPDTGRPSAAGKAASVAGGTGKEAARKAVKTGVEAAAASATGGASKAVFALLPTPLDSPAVRKKKTRRLAIIAVAIIIVLVGVMVAGVIAVLMLVSMVVGGGGGGPLSPGECLAVDAQQAGGGPDAPRPSRGSGQMGYPVDPDVPITSPFGPRWGSFHDGLDFGAPAGAPIYAVADGVVVAAGPASGYDTWIRIEHTIDGQKVESLYGHMDIDSHQVKVGDQVHAGQQIAAVGVPGPSTPGGSDSTTGAHLHFGIYPGGWSVGGGVDPMPYLDKLRASQPKHPSAPSGDNVLVVGDSLAKGAEAALADIMPGIEVDAVVGRPFSGATGGAQVVRDRIDDLPAVLVVELGTNTGVSAEDYHGLVNEIHNKSPDTTVVVVNTYGPQLAWTDQTNQAIESTPGTTLVDWHAEATAHPNVVGPDHVHPNPEGLNRYAQLIVDGIHAAGASSSAQPAPAVPADAEQVAATGASPNTATPPPDGSVTAADWEKLAQCESGGKWDINTGNGFYGGLQFTQQTWEGFGGTQYAASADRATKEQQMEIANKVLAEQGWGAWPACTNSTYPELKSLTPAPPGTFVGAAGQPATQNTPGGQAAGPTLQDTLDTIVADAHSQGVELGVAVRAVDGGTPVNAGKADTAVYPASAIKVAIAAAVEAHLKPDDDVEVSADDVVGGTGSGLTAGHYRVSDLETAMITVSDNTATNALIDAVGGFDTINTIIADAGVSGGYRIANKMMSGNTSSTMTATGAAQFLDALWDASRSDGGFITQPAANHIIDLMRQQTIRTKLPAQLPDGATATKTGENTGVSHDIGFIWAATGTPYAAAVTSTFDGPADTANGFIAQIGKAIYDTAVPSTSGSSAGQPLAPTPSTVGSEDGLQTDAVRGMRLAAQRFPEVTTIDGYRSGDPSPDVAAGRAIDIIVPDGPAGGSLGDRVAALFTDNAAELHVQYVTFNGRIWDAGTWGQAPQVHDAPATRVRVTFQGGGAPNSDTRYVGVGSEETTDAAAAAPRPASGDQLSQNLTPEQQATIKQIIVQAKNADFVPAQRAAVLGVMMSGYAANFINMDAADDPNKVGIFAETPLGSRSASQIMDISRTAKQFMDELKKETDKRPSWASDKASDVLVAAFPNRASFQQELDRWEAIATEIVTKLWDDPNARRGMGEETLPAAVQSCAVGSAGGQPLNEGQVPAEFVKWLKLAARECDGIDAPLLAAQIQQESGFQQHGHNAAGAAGYTQFIDATWQTWGHKVDEQGRPIGPPGSGDRNNVGDAVMAQARYMCSIQNTIKGWMDEGKVKGDLTELTLAGYNAGEHRILEFRGMPTGGEFSTQTQPYVDNILRMRQRYASGTIGERASTSSGARSGGARLAATGDSSIGARVLQAARTADGKPYVWGGNGPDSYDCSGLTVMAYRAVGIEIPRTAAQQYHAGKKEIPWDQAQPGDLIFSSFSGGEPGHVSIYVSPSRHYEAQTEGVPVGEHDVWADDMVVMRMY